MVDFAWCIQQQASLSEQNRTIEGYVGHAKTRFYPQGYAALKYYARNNV